MTNRLTQVYHIRITSVPKVNGNSKSYEQKVYTKCTQNVPLKYSYISQMYFVRFKRIWYTSSVHKKTVHCTFKTYQFVLRTFQNILGTLPKSQFVTFFLLKFSLLVVKLHKANNCKKRPFLRPRFCIFDLRF